MAKTYQVKVLTGKEWERIRKSDPRYEHVDEDNLGFADPKTRTAYIRNTQVFELNKYLIDHEIEHLMEEHGTDEDEFGVRHKKGFLRNYVALMAAPFTGGSSLFTGNAKQRPVIGQPNQALNQAANFGYQTVLPIVGGTLGGSVGGPPGAALGAGAGSALGNVSTGQRAVGQKALLAGGAAGIGSAVMGGLSNLGSGTGTSPPVGGGITPVTPALPSTPHAPGIANSQIAAPRASSLSAFNLGSANPSGNLSPGVFQNALTRSGGISNFGEPSVGALGGAGISGGVKQLTLQPGQGVAMTGTQGGATTAGGGQRYLPGLTGTGANPPYQPPGQPQPPQPPGGGGGGFWNAIASGLGGASPGLASVTRQGVRDAAQLGAAGAALNTAVNDPRGQIPPVPNFAEVPSVKNLAQTAGQGRAVSPLGNLGQTQLSARLTEPFQGINPQVEASVRHQFDLRRAAEASSFKTIRPNADPLTDSAYRNLLSQIDRDEAQTIGQLNQQEFTNFQARRTQDISSALGVNTETLGTLTNLAQLDIDQIQMQLGIDAAQAMQFKRTFGQVAGLLAARPLGLTNFSLQPQGAGGII